jgi:TPR repeat protein
MKTDISKEARKLLESACELFESGKRKEAIKIFLKAASMGSTEAQVNVANIYDDGEGVKNDFAKARYWYKRAISGGSPQGAYNLGVSYLNRGNTRWAKHWLSIAKAMGDEDAQDQLIKLG